MMAVHMYLVRNTIYTTIYIYIGFQMDSESDTEKHIHNYDVRVR